MNARERERQLKAAWDQIRRGLGNPLGEHLDDARAFVGDRAILQLLNDFEPGEVIIACGIQIAEELIGLNVRDADNEKDGALTAAIMSAREAERRRLMDRGR